MEKSPPPPPPPPVPPPPSVSPTPSVGSSAPGLALASVLLGILGLLFSFLVAGGFLGLIGLACGAAYLLKRRRPVAMARWGVVLSVLSLIASLGCAMLYYRAYKEFEKFIQSSSGNDEEDFRKWEGVRAPDIAVTTLDGQQIKLSDLKGRRVVLDFFATWCPPSRAEIGRLIQLSNHTSRNDLVIIGISEEEEATLRNFVRQRRVNYPIASATDLPSPYGDIGSIPTTFFIDRKGVIQTVEVGECDYEEIKRDALGEDFPGEPKAAPVLPATLPNASRMLKPTLLWSKNIPGAQALCLGDWESNGTPRVLVAAGSTLHVLDLNGTEMSSVLLPDSFTMISCGRDGEKGVRLLGCNTWGNVVTVMDHSGRTLWSVTADQGVDGAHWGDLYGDGTDEMIVGMNGSGGLQAWSAEGKKLWSADLANVWNQAIVPAGKDQSARVMATSAEGSVNVFDARGQPMARLKPDGAYYTQINAGRMDDKSIQIAAIGNNGMVVFDETGKIAWGSSSYGTPSWRTSNLAAGDLKGDGEVDWAFIDGSGDLVLATPKGEKVAAISHAGKLTSFAIVSRPGKGGVLVTLENGTLLAYDFRP